MRVLAFAGSNSRKSINRRLADHAADRLREAHAPAAEVDHLDLNDHEMPLYSIDREQADGVPAEAARFLDRIAAADALLVSFAEHNGSYTVAFKNVLDWASRIERQIWQDTPLVLLATSPGGRGGRSVLSQAVEAAPRWGGTVCGSLSVPRFPKAFDVQAGVLRDPELAASLDQALADLVAHVEQVRDAA